MTERFAIVVGAGPGIGAATARRLAAEGYGIGLVARSPERLDGLVAEVEAAGVPCTRAAADAGDEAGLGAAVRDLVEGAGGADVLLYNTSRYREAGASALTAAELLADLAVGAAGFLTAAHAVLPAMRSRGAGTILATGSGAADRPIAAATSLGVQKVALRHLAGALADDVRADGVHVATLTIHGFVRDGTPFAPDRVADVYAGLVAETAADPGTWRTCSTSPPRA